MMLSKSEAVSKINELGDQCVPFFFFTDFLGDKTWIKPIDQIATDELEFQFQSNSQQPKAIKDFTFKKYPPSEDTFSKSFQYVVDEINMGYSYLVNLTFRTPIETNLTINEIFSLSKAKYKVRFADKFVTFSPETFVQIRGGKIFSYPMKGTIDANIPEAAKTILEDVKETAEHVTIVDLIRNDLSQIATNVEVTKFRFISEVNTHEKKLLQVSSEIQGNLPPDFNKNLGTLLFKLLPAGSISGAPKPETIKIIQQAETYDRGFYTGICGHFDGENLDSGVMIRFIEKVGNQLFYKSGGGITSFSKMQKEYQEIIDKIYIPIH